MTVALFIFGSILGLPLFFVPSRAKHPYFFAVTALLAGLVLSIAGKVLTGGGDISIERGPVGWPAGSPVLVDKLAAFFLVMISLGAVSAALYSWGYMKPYRKRRPAAHISLHLFSFILLFISIVSVVTARDGYGFLFSWELMSVSSFILILFDARRPEVRRAALSYIVMMHVGFVFLLAGFAVVASKTGCSTFEGMAVYFSQGKGIPMFLVFLAGFGMKAGIFPLHSWLPEAHPAAPAHVSAFMSGVMIKTGVYGMLRVLSAMGEGLAAGGMILLVVGIVTALYGALLAAVQNDMKRLLAYSSIENIGIIFTAMGAAAIGYTGGNALMTVCALSGALLHTLNHSFFKSVLFFGAGNVYRAAHTTSLEALGGLSRRMPLTTAFFLFGVVAICALPPLSGFVSEFLIYYGFFDTVCGHSGGLIASIAGIVALSLTGGIVLLAFTKLFGVGFLGSARSPAAAGASEVDRLSLAAFAIPIAGIVCIGLAPSLFIAGVMPLVSGIFGLEVSPQIYGSFTARLWEISLAAGIFISLTLLSLYMRQRILRRHKEEKSPVWGCGFSSSSHKMQYSGESFSEGLYGISTSLTKNSGGGEVVDKNEIFPTRHSFDVKHKDKVATLISRWWLQTSRKVAKRAVRFNTGKINHYVMYALVFLVLIFILTLMEVI
ncbi:MAG: NADH-quinone oxidoreductase subunit E [Rikenellaceae bacterium]|nr:NADH-quinone oxidoreductase subunit E [Rikenellaceae bacterium]